MSKRHTKLARVGNFQSSEQVGVQCVHVLVWQCSVQCSVLPDGDSVQYHPGVHTWRPNAHPSLQVFRNRWDSMWKVLGHSVKNCNTTQRMRVSIEYYISFLVCNACFMYTGMEDTQQKRERIFFITHILYIYFVYYNMMRCVVPLEIIKYLIAWLLIF